MQQRYPLTIFDIASRKSSTPQNSKERFPDRCLSRTLWRLARHLYLFPQPSDVIELGDTPPPPSHTHRRLPEILTVASWESSLQQNFTPPSEQFRLYSGRTGEDTMPILAEYIRSFYGSVDTAPLPFDISIEPNASLRAMLASSQSWSMYVNVFWACPPFTNSMTTIATMELVMGQDAQQSPSSSNTSAAKEPASNSFQTSQVQRSTSYKYIPQWLLHLTPNDNLHSRLLALSRCSTLWNSKPSRKFSLLHLYSQFWRERSRSRTLNFFKRSLQLKLRCCYPGHLITASNLKSTRTQVLKILLLHTLMILLTFVTSFNVSDRVLMHFTDLGHRQRNARRAPGLYNLAVSKSPSRHCSRFHILKGCTGF